MCRVTQEGKSEGAEGGAGRGRAALGAQEQSRPWDQTGQFTL